MHRTLRSAIASALSGAVLLASPGIVFGATWDIDPVHSAVGFSVRHMMVSTVHGSFGKYTAWVSIDDADIAKSTAHIEIDAASISTGNDKRDDHLRSADFFDVAHFPKIVFDSTRVERRGQASLSLTGNLTIRNVTRPVVLDVSGLTGEVKDPWGGTRRGATATTKISRKDFGLNWNKALDTGGVVVGDEVTIVLEVELTKKNG
ncbi:MAG TPA: YceI family protein [Polyangiaceae bacterium]|nr:YceI family protein [Polyangiaceae bacterium]